MNIGKVATLTNLSVKQIRDYEKLGLIAPTHQADNGYRTYTTANVERLQFIAHARSVGFSLAQIGELLAIQDSQSQMSACQVKALTANHIADLTNKINQLETMKTALQSWHDACTGVGESCAILDELKKPLS